MAAGKKSSHKNAARSRHLIKTAFAELLNEKDISKITVTDIVERANISRGTFYAHYLDVYDLYSAIQSNIVEAIDEMMDELGMENIILDPTQAISFGISFLEKNKNYYKLFLTSSHGEKLIKRVMSLAEDKFIHLIVTTLPEENIQEHICHLYYTLGGIRNILIHWFMNTLEISSEECAEYLSKFYLENRPTKLYEIIKKNKELSQEQSQD